MGRTKITIKAFSGLWTAFGRELELLPIKRDIFLSNVVRVETQRLAEAMEGKRLSPRVRRHVAGQLARLGTETISLAVDKDVADALNAVVRRSNMVRDAFFNRLFAFLRSSDSLLDHLNLPREHTPGRIGRAIIVDVLAPTSPVKALQSVFSDPLYFLHETAKDLYDGANLYLLDLPSPKWDGIACFLDDNLVPGTPGHRRSRLEEEILMRTLQDIEFDLPSARLEAP